jgi:hypothetical protein
MVMGASLLIEMRYNGDILDPRTSDMQKDMRKGLDWFMSNNSKAYMVLLD